MLNYIFKLKVYLKLSYNRSSYNPLINIVYKNNIEPHLDFSRNFLYSVEDKIIVKVKHRTKKIICSIGHFSDKIRHL